MKIAITGSIGSGKSTAAAHIRDKGFFVFDCDAYNAYLLEEGNEGYLKVREAFPEAFESSFLNKTRLAHIIFNDKEKKALLESLLHPLIIEEMLRQAERNEIFFAEVPLLFENDLDVLFDMSLLIVCDEDIALERLIERGVSEEEAKRRIANQMSVIDKINRADEIIYNNGKLADLQREIDAFLEEHVR